MSELDVNQAKHELRAQLRTQRAHHVQEVDCADQFTEALLELATEDKVVACYLSFGDEPETRTFVEAAFGAGKRVLLPVANKDGSITWLNYNGQTETGIFGFDEPKGTVAKLADASLVIVPALAVEENGRRLGRGRGFYDRALQQANPSALVIALVHDGEVLETLPVEPHDFGLDGHIVCKR